MQKSSKIGNIFSTIEQYPNKSISYMINAKLFGLVAFPWDKIEQYSK